MLVRTQSQLIMENMQMCYAITMSYYFFGHNATTAVGQEEQTGILTGLGDFIRGQAPVALSMPPAVYEDYYRSPWATSTQFEDRHKKISTEIGLSFRGRITAHCSGSPIVLRCGCPRLHRHVQPDPLQRVGRDSPSLEHAGQGHRRH